MGEQWSEIEGLAANVDLDALVINLNRNNIEHKIIRENDQTRLWIRDAADTVLTLEIVNHIQRMASISQQAAKMRPPKQLILRAYITRVPITLMALVLCIFGAILVTFFPDLTSIFTFLDFTIIGGREISFEPLDKMYEQNQWWRLITPAFLHFGVFHLVFNGLWLWEFGRRIELLVGSGAYLVLLSALSIGANVGQYLWSGPALFGGFSGVVYGLLGYIWVRNKRISHPLLKLPSAIFPLMIGWLLICLLGVVDLFLQGSVANGAHVSGLLIGMVFGAFAGQRQREAV